jgi:hypothetical protein
MMTGEQIALSITIILLAISIILNTWQAFTYRHLRDAMHAAAARREQQARQCTSCGRCAQGE